eukprot:16040946-Heterocapsa_arctica.AAC.1
MGKDTLAHQPDIRVSSGGRHDPGDGRSGAQLCGEDGPDAVLRCLDRRIPWAQGGEEGAGIQVRAGQEQPIRLGAAWSNLRL